VPELSEPSLRQESRPDAPCLSESQIRASFSDEPAARNAGFIRQTRRIGHAQPDESGVPRARWSMAPKRDNFFAIDAPLILSRFPQPQAAGETPWSQARTT
jgi:hypothetical protein